VNGRRISVGDAKYWAVLTLSVVHAEGQS
jgi:hypothetical protein